MGVSEHGVRHLGHLHLVLRRRHLLHRRHDGRQCRRTCLVEARKVTFFCISNATFFCISNTTFFAFQIPLFFAFQMPPFFAFQMPPLFCIPVATISLVLNERRSVGHKRQHKQQECHLKQDYLQEGWTSSKQHPGGDKRRPDGCC